MKTFPGLLISGILILAISNNALAGGIYCEALCVTTAKYGTWMDGMPQIVQSRKVIAKSPQELVEKCTSSDSGEHTRLVSDYDYKSYGSYNAFNGQPYIYLHKFELATEANSCRDASMAPLKQ